MNDCIKLKSEIKKQKEVDSNITYILRAELHNRMDEKELQSYMFERRFHLKFLEKTGQDSTFYDPELKLNFEDSSAVAFIYEIETQNSETICGDELEKATDFIRRINYMYDWIQLRVNKKGKVLSVENKEELTDQWQKIKESLLSDYKGKEVDKYLEEIDRRVEDGKMFWGAVSQYFHFGLLFPHIPQVHGQQWDNKRLIEFSEYEEEQFEEHIVFEKLENSSRMYSLDVKPLGDSETKLEKYEGKITVPEYDIFPTSVLLEVVFQKNDVANQWYFKLERE